MNGGVENRSEGDADREFMIDERIKFSLDAYTYLEGMAIDLKTTKEDTLRRALGLLRLVIEKGKEGYITILENPETGDRQQITKY